MIKYNISDFPVSGECFSVTYSLSGDEKEALLKAEDICLEQTVEFPPDLLPEKLRNTVAGKIKSFEKSAEGIFKTLIEFPVETSAF